MGKKIIDIKLRRNASRGRKSKAGGGGKIKSDSIIYTPAKTFIHKFLIKRGALIGLNLALFFLPRAVRCMTVQDDWSIDWFFCLFVYQSACGFIKNILGPLFNRLKWIATLLLSCLMNLIILSTMQMCFLFGHWEKISLWLAYFFQIVKGCWLCDREKVFMT